MQSHSLVPRSPESVRDCSAEKAKRWMLVAELDTPPIAPPATAPQASKAAIIEGAAIERS
jgi:hypothetical protein